MGPVCTIMVGRLDDWLKVVMDKQNIITDPGYLEWAGVAVFKKAYRIFRERGYRIRLLSAAFRNHMHWSELIGGDVVHLAAVHMADAFQRQRHHRWRPDRHAGGSRRSWSELRKKFPDFGRAYNEDGLSVEEFDTFGPTRRTLRQFIEACHEMCAQVRELMLPNPDKEL